VKFFGKSPILLGVVESRSWGCGSKPRWYFEVGKRARFFRVMVVPGWLPTYPLGVESNQKRSSGNR